MPVYGTPGADTLSGASDSVFGFGGDDSLHGSYATLVGGEGADTLDFYGGSAAFGDAGDDLIIGGTQQGFAGIVHGGDGQDTISLDIYTGLPTQVFGDAGDDVIALRGANWAAWIAGGPGADRISGPGLLYAGDTLNSPEGDADTLIGSEGSDTLFSGGGADVLDGGGQPTGARDLAVIDWSGQSAAIDMRSAAPLGAGSAIVGIELFRVTGGSADDTLVGPGTLSGGDGDDLLLFGSGADVVSGGDGADTILGNALLPGTDALPGDSIEGGMGDDVIQLGLLSRQADGGDGNDSIIAGASVSLPTVRGGGGNDTIQDSWVAEGGDGDDLLLGIRSIGRGGAGADTIAGLAGATMEGGEGDDVYVLTGLPAFIDDDGGTDLVLSSISFELPDDIENLTLTGSAARQGLGNTLANRILGNDGNNWLSGRAGNDTLIGGAGDDVLVGGLGTDRLEGGAGNDTYRVGAGDLVIEAASGGADRIVATASQVLVANVEYLTLQSAAGQTLSGTGNALANHMIGGDGQDLLSGGAGYDTLIGFGGSDTLEGGYGNDVLSGWGDSDLLVGGAGADTLTGGARGDLFLFRAPGEGGDVITDFTPGSDRILLSAQGFGGIAALGFALDAASGPGPVVIYAGASGTLWWDADGTGAGAAVLLATLSGAPALAATDIVLTG